MWYRFSKLKWVWDMTDGIDYSYAYVKANSEEEAIKYIDWHKGTDKAYTPKYNGGYEIDFRKGEYNRCKGNYCSVADFCQQYQQTKGD